MNEFKGSPRPPRKPPRNDLAIGLIALVAVAAFAMSLCVAGSVTAFLLFQIATPALPVPAAAAPPVVASAPPVAPRAPVVPPPVPPKPSYVPKPPPPAEVPKPGPTRDNPVTPALPHAKYDPTIDEKSFAGILAEEYPEPRKLAGKVTSYLKFVSPKGDYVGGGTNRAYDLSAGTAFTPRHNGNRGVTARAGPWGIDFAAPGGAETPSVGKYPGAMRFPFQDADKPGLSFYGDGRGNNFITGSFAVWQLDIEDGEVVALAVDFLQRSDGRGPPLLGRLRYKSKYE